MQSGLTWRRLFQGESHTLPTLPLASYLWWRPGSELLLPLIAKGCGAGLRTLLLVFQW